MDNKVSSKVRMICSTLSYPDFNNKSSKWLADNIDWLKNISYYGVDIFLHNAEKLGFVKSDVKYKKTNTAEENSILYYKITPLGRKMLKKYHNGDIEEVESLI